MTIFTLRCRPGSLDLARSIFLFGYNSRAGPDEGDLKKDFYRNLETTAHGIFNSHEL